MPQVVSGQTGYLGGETGGQGNGVGAVIFDAPSVNRANAGNMLFQALSSRAKQMNDAQIDKEKDLQTKSFAMLDGIDIDKQGVFEPDLPYFQEKTQDLIKKRGEIYAKYGGDITSKQALQDINALDGEKAKLKLEALQSANDKKMYADATSKFVNNPSKYQPDLSTKGLEAYKSAPLGARAGVQTLHEAPPILMDIMDKHSKTIGDDTEITGTYTENGKVVQKSIKGKSPEKVNVAFQTLYQANPDARMVADAEFEKLPESEKQNMEAIKAISGQTNVPTAQIWLGRVASNNYSTKNELMKGMGNNMYEQDRLARGRMAYGQQLKNEDKESAIYKLTSAYASGDAPEVSTEIIRTTPQGQEKVFYAPASLKSGVFTVTADGKPTNVENTFLGTISRNVNINGQPTKIVYKIDTKSLVEKGILSQDSINKQNGVVNVTGGTSSLQSKIIDNLDKFPVMNAGDAMFIAKANGASDKAIEATNKNYGAYSGGGMVDVTKINKQIVPEKRNVGQAVPKVTKTTVEVKPKEAPKKEVQKEKIVNGVKMPFNATPKYSKQTGKLMGYELPDGTKFKL